MYVHWLTVAINHGQAEEVKGAVYKSVCWGWVQQALIY